MTKEICNQKKLQLKVSYAYYTLKYSKKMLTINSLDVNRSLYTNNRIQSQSFPELSKAVDNSTKTVRQLSDSTRSFQPSKLPINKTR